MSKSQYANWYAGSRWRKRRAAHLAQEPLCRYCAKQGLIREADVVDHIDPHRGDRTKFYLGAIQSLCHHCHSSVKQREDKGIRVGITGLDGWPVDDVTDRVNA